MDYVADVKKYTSPVDEAAVSALESRYRLVLSRPDSQLVAFSDPEELERVKKNFLIEKLGLTDADDLDGAIESVREKMQDAHRKNRLTVYYLLADYFGKLDVVVALGN